MNEQEEQGQRLVNAVERLLDDPGDLIALVDRLTRVVQAEQPTADAGTLQDAVSERIVEHFATRAAISGGATALPGLLPGLGSLVAISGGTLVDVALTLKFEVEMAMALCWNHGFDIRDPDERRVAFLLASVFTEDSVPSGKPGSDFLSDMAKAEGVALWQYAPRQIPKLIVQVSGRILVRHAAKGLARALPLVGIAVGGTVNRTLTKRVGTRCIQELKKRQLEREATAATGDVVDAVVVEPKEGE